MSIDIGSFPGVFLFHIRKPRTRMRVRGWALSVHQDADLAVVVEVAEDGVANLVRVTLFIDLELDEWLR